MKRNSLFLILFLFRSSLQADSQTFLINGTWNAPAGVTSVTAQVWGGGGGGNNTAVCSGGGGGGGAFSSLAATVVPGVGYTVTVGTAGIAGDPAAFNGGDSWFITISSVLARGGRGAILSVAGLGGASGTGVGDTKFSGGNGGTGDISGGGGGSSGGTASNGGNGGNGDGSGSSGGAGGTPPSGAGSGGAGGDDSTQPQDGFSPGGGGGGRGCDTSGDGDGSAGKIVLTWTGSASGQIIRGADQ